MKITATGDALLIQGFPEDGYEGFDEVRNFIMRGDARVGNLETTVTDWDTYPSAYSGGTWLSCEPRVLDHYLRLGINFISLGNNHGMDMGPDGLLETIEHVKRRGVAFAGAGADLYKASEPAYRTFASGRAAMISITASFNDAARAGYTTRTLKGRPGINPLRKKFYISITPEHFNVLSEIIKNTRINGSREICIRDGFYPKFPEGTLRIGDYTFIRTENGREEKCTRCNKHDLERTAVSLKDASYIADYRIVYSHNHVIKGDDMGEPDDAEFDFAHFCIDNGADAFIGTGVHEFQPIEIYKGRPIFHSLGNFCFQSNMLTYQPYDQFEKFGYPPTMTDIQIMADKNKDWTIGLHTKKECFRTCIPYLEYDRNRLVKAEILPVDLGFEKDRTFKGIPYRANEKQTKEIYERLASLSEPFGTKLVLRQDGIIEIVLD